ncbi:hypothetical protein [Lysinibacillus xylanilyticus]|uniref:hypothetical protein n=1 Tax=Lysinibacillus xylanilyticus TaxID=582475 RepID=UPI000A74270C|nr:hypothetical protein [Lysinibacillus xylanilyticus]
MFFARKRSVNVAAAKCFCLCESVVQRSDSNSTMLVTKALSQDVMILAFVPLFADPQGVAQPPLQSTYFHSRRFNKSHPQLLMMNLFNLDLPIFSVLTTTNTTG